MAKLKFPQKGTPGEEVLATLQSLKSGDSDYKHGRMFSLIFNAGEDVARVAEEAYTAFVVENGLSPFAFPSLLKMETEV
ncbi:MAG: aspartate aminotransferase family protein, partial [Chloroflexi bacterium]|nr:aspartate aminotransferase family protein [Chloroflexota bacterium]